MATVKTIRLAENEAPRLRLEFEGSNARIKLDGAEVAQLRGFAEMKRGWKTTLADGRVLEVRTQRPVLLPEMSVLVNGRHAPDSPSNPRKMLRGSAEGLLIGGAIFVVLALMGRRTANAYSITLEILQVLGAVLLLRRMYLGLVLVAVAVLADFLVMDLWLVTAPSPRLLWPIAARLLFGAFVIRAFIALRDVRRDVPQPTT
jgi:hypothetical protein